MKGKKKIKSGNTFLTLAMLEMGEYKQYLSFYEYFQVQFIYEI